MTDREINLLIHEKICGLDSHYGFPNYINDDGLAVLILNSLIRRGWHYQINDYGESFITVDLWNNEESMVVSTEKSFARAVGLAALRALGGRVEHEDL